MFRVVEYFQERITLINYLITANILQVTLYRMYLILYTHTKASSMINLKEVMNFYEGKEGYMEDLEEKNYLFIL